MVFLSNWKGWLTDACYFSKEASMKKNNFWGRLLLPLMLLGILLVNLAGPVKAESKNVNPLDSSDFVVLSDVVPDIIQEIRYYSTYNFVGERITGYQQPCALMTKEAALALKAVSDFVNLAVKVACIHAILDVIAVVENRVHHAGGIHMAVHFFVFFLPGGRVGFADDFSEIQRVDKAHQVLAGFLMDVQFWLLGPQFFQKGRHAHHATHAGTGVGLDVGVVLEHFGEVLHHALGDSLVLCNSQLCQVSCSRGGVFVQVLGPFQQALAQVGKLVGRVGFCKSAIKKMIMVGGLMKAAAVPAVMAYVERLVTGRSLGVLGGGSGVGVVVAAHLAEILGKSKNHNCEQ